MDYSLTTNQQTLQKELKTFVQQEVNTQLCSEGWPVSFNRDLWKKCADAGLLSLGTKETRGLVRDSDFITMVIALETLGYTCSDNGLPFALATQVCTVQQSLLHHGSVEQKETFLAGSIEGILIGCHAMTEPEAGSDSSNISMLATPTNDGFSLTGEKIMIGLAPVADYCILFATVNPDAGRWGQTAFLIPTNTPGLTVNGPIKKLGLDSSPMGTITLSNCEIPANYLLGPQGAGAAIANHSLEFERTCILASQVGRMQRQLEIALDHAKSRKQFGRPVVEFQAVSHRLADMRVRIETARLLLYKTAWKIDQGQRAMLESSMLKLIISESFLTSSIDSMRIFGGYSYINEHETGKDVCDALGGVLYAGTSDIQRNIIAGLIELP